MSKNSLYRWRVERIARAVFNARHAQIGLPSVTWSNAIASRKRKYRNVVRLVLDAIEKDKP